MRRTGSRRDTIDAQSQEAPDPFKPLPTAPVKVFLSRGYWLGRYELTQSEWKQVMATEPWKEDKF